MRILMVSDFYPPLLGGVEVVVSTLARGLAERGHDVAVATLAVDGPPAIAEEDGVRVHRIAMAAQRAGLLFASEARPWAPPVPDPLAALALRRVMAQERPDVVHGHDWLARSCLAALSRDVAFVQSLHHFTLNCPKKNLMHRGAPCSGPGPVKCLGCAGRHYGRAKGAAVVLGQRAFAPLEARRADLFLPVSESTARRSGLPGSRVRYVVIPNPVGPPRPVGGDGALLGALPDEPYLLFVGDIRRDKGIHVLLEAYGRLAAPPPLVLLGKAWPETPRTLPAGVRILRDWPNAAVRAAMARCLALVVPSVWPEPFGLVAAEALTAERPVVASAIGGLPEVVRDGREGLLVEPGAPGELAAALQRIVADDSLRDALGRGAAERAGAFALDSIVPRVEEAYATAIRHRRAGRPVG